MGADVFKIIKGKPVLVDYVKDNAEIDEDTVKKIREKYSEKDELKLHRQVIKKGQLTPEFEEYNTYVEQCREEGKTLKLSKNAFKGSLKKVKIQDGDQEREILTIPDEG